MTAAGIARILVIDDEPQIRKFLRISLNAYGYEVIEAVRGEDGLGKCATASPDLVILDLGLPDLDGHEVIARIREWSKVPIIVLSVRAAEDEKVAALDHGADDYVTKPFGIHELLARVRAVLRGRRQDGEPPPAVVTVGDLSIDLPRRRVRLAGAEIRTLPQGVRDPSTPGAACGTHRHPPASVASGLGAGARARDPLSSHLCRPSAPEARRRSG